jgi:hypothetical protein
MPVRGRLIACIAILIVAVFLSGWHSAEFALGEQGMSGLIGMVLVYTLSKLDIQLLLAEVIRLRTN